MATKLVVWTRTAVLQRRKILEYWTLRNKSTTYAEKLIVLIRERIDLISENPLAGKKTNHSKTREAAMGNFSIYYQLRRNRIYIMAFWDNRQDPQKLIDILKK